MRWAPGSDLEVRGQIQHVNYPLLEHRMDGQVVKPGLNTSYINLKVKLRVRLHVDQCLALDHHFVLGAFKPRRETVKSSRIFRRSNVQLNGRIWLDIKHCPFVHKESLVSAH
jgi:hypothetical protein